MIELIYKPHETRHIAVVVVFLDINYWLPIIN